MHLVPGMTPSGRSERQQVAPGTCMPPAASGPTKVSVPDPAVCRAYLETRQCTGIDLPRCPLFPASEIVTITHR